MTGRLSPESLRAYVDRPWDSLREAKQKHWAQRMSAAESLALGSALWEHVRAVDPTWPDETQRAADYSHHLELAEKMRRLSDVFTRRRRSG